MDRSTENSQDEGRQGDKPPSHRARLLENERVAKSRIIACIIEGTDTCSECGSIGNVTDRSAYGDRYACPTCGKSWALDTNPERHTLTKLHAKLKDYIPRSTLHKYLKQLVDQRWLVEESDEIKALNNQPMKIVRYVVNPSRAEMARQMIADRRAKDRP